MKTVRKLRHPFWVNSARESQTSHGAVRTESQTGTCEKDNIMVCVYTPHPTTVYFSLFRAVDSFHTLFLSSWQPPRKDCSKEGLCSSLFFRGEVTTWVRLKLKLISYLFTILIKLNIFYRIKDTGIKWTFISKIYTWNLKVSGTNSFSDKGVIDIKTCISLIVNTSGKNSVGLASFSPQR